MRESSLTSSASIHYTRSPTLRVNAIKLPSLYSELSTVAQCFLPTLSKALDKAIPYLIAFRWVSG